MGYPELDVGRNLVEKTKGDVKVSQLPEKPSMLDDVINTLDVQGDKDEALTRLKGGISPHDQVP